MRFIAATLLALSAIVSAGTAEKTVCKNPVKHVEWRSLSQAQRNSYHKAVKCLKTKKSNVNGTTLFDRYPSVHDNVFDEVHHVAKFLPWHRWFLWMRRLDLQACGYTGPSPYWDWTIDSPKLAKSKIFDPKTGFGGNGNTRTQDHCVQDGPYANFQLSYPEPHCLARRFNNGNVRSGTIGSMQGSRYSKEMVKHILKRPDFINFSNDFEDVCHDAIHNVIAGDMAVAFSPNDPLFWLHHQQVDRVWTQWQGRNATRLKDYGGNTDPNQDPNEFPFAKITDKLPMQNIRGVSDLTVADVLDTMSSKLCYVYDK